MLAETGYIKKKELWVTPLRQPLFGNITTVSLHPDQTPDPVQRIIFSVEPAKRLIIPRAFKI
jgi:hypothetical protein